MSDNGPKDVCLLSGDGYFIDAVRIFYDQRAGDYVMPPSAVEAPYPDITKVDNGYLARWDKAAQKWRYEIEDYSFNTVDVDPLEVLKASIETKMDAAKDKIIEAFVDGDSVKQQVNPPSPRAAAGSSARETPRRRRTDYPYLFAPSAPSALIDQRSRSDVGTRRAPAACRTCPCTCVLF